MHYDPIKNVFASIIKKFPFLRIFFYKSLDLMFLRSWYVRRELKKLRKKFGGKETSGTALFIYGMAWGVNNGILDAKKYIPAITKGWEAMANEALHSNGFLGYVQGTAKRPSAGQPVSYTQKPDFEDFGIGCFLLAGSEVYKLHDYSARDWLSRLTALLTFP